MAILNTVRSKWRDGDPCGPPFQGEERSCLLKEDISVAVNDVVMTIKGKRASEKEVDEDDY